GLSWRGGTAAAVWFRGGPASADRGPGRGTVPSGHGSPFGGSAPLVGPPSATAGDAAAAAVRIRAAAIEGGLAGDITLRPPSATDETAAETTAVAPARDGSTRAARTVGPISRSRTAASAEGRARPAIGPTPSVTPRRCSRSRSIFRPRAR